MIASPHVTTLRAQHEMGVELDESRDHLIARILSKEVEIFARAREVSESLFGVRSKQDGQKYPCAVDGDLVHALPEQPQHLAMLSDACGVQGLGEAVVAVRLDPLGPRVETGEPSIGRLSVVCLDGTATERRENRLAIHRVGEARGGALPDLIGEGALSPSLVADRRHEVVEAMLP